MSRRLRREESKCSARLLDLQDRRPEASDKKVERLIDLRFRHFTIRLMGLGGEISRKQRIAEWSDGRQEVKDVEITKGVTEPVEV